MADKQDGKRSGEKSITMDSQAAIASAIARKLKDARTNPPTFWSQLLRWSSLLGLLAVGIAGTVALAVMSLQSGGAFPRDWPIAYAALFLGAICRDIGIARRTTRAWAAQTPFIDWAKVDEAAAE
jgi:hypothetical protein